MSTHDRLTQRFIDEVRELHASAVQRDAKFSRIKTADLALLIEMAERETPEAVLDLTKLAAFGRMEVAFPPGSGTGGVPVFVPFPTTPDQPLPPGTVLCEGPVK